MKCELCGEIVLNCSWCNCDVEEFNPNDTWCQDDAHFCSCECSLDYNRIELTKMRPESHDEVEENDM